MVKPAVKSLLLGLGLDCDDGHVRVTRGPNFRLFGGAEGTHSLMQEKALKFNEHLKRRGKTLDDLSHQEFREIADKIGMKSPPPG